MMVKIMVIVILIIVIIIIIVMLIKVLCAVAAVASGCSKNVEQYGSEPACSAHTGVSRLWKIPDANLCRLFL